MIQSSLIIFAPVCGVYVVRNLITEFCYIGQSDNVPLRIATHVKYLSRGIAQHTNRKMLEDFQAYGLDSFQYEVLEECDKGDLLKRESYWVYNYDELGKSLYNIKKMSGNYTAVLKASA